MQVAATAFSASHYHAYYQLHAPGPHDHALKRQYLALLPPQQIIDICLQFDIHVSPYVKGLIWPPDINAAIAGLQKAPPKPSEEKPPEVSSKVAVAAMDSLKSHDETSPSIQDSLPPVEPQPPDKPDSNTLVTDAAPPPGSSATTAPSSPQPAQGPTSSAPSVPEPPQPTPAAAPATTTQPPYPYAYAHPQPAYPHTPYYPPHAGYTYSYGSYPAPMQAAYHPQPPPPATSYPPQPSIFNNAMTMHQSQLENVGGDDLPSYEEMLVEALAACSDPEGCAPKDLFTWMATRYPLQSNFRPSASQALQKAYKRGRFEKGSNGKYRINAGYIGANVIRRTTRRPQTHNTQSTTGNSAPAGSPFTNAPLVPGHSSSTSAQQSSSASYSYPYAGYSGYPPHPAASTTSSIPGAPTSTQSTTEPKPAAATSATTDPDTAAAYEAAKNILSAINFGDLYQLAPEERADGATHDTPAQQATVDALTADNGVENLLSHVQAMLANAKAEGNNHNNPPHQNPLPPGAAAGLGTVPTTTTALPQVETDPSPDRRAELQAQLALLAAQLADLAKTEEVPLPPQHPQPQVAFATPSSPAHPPPPPIAAAAVAPPPVVAAVTTTTSIHAPSTPMVSAPAESEPPHEMQEPERPIEGEDDDSDDDDMEEII